MEDSGLGSHASSGGGHRPKILLVDDDEVLLGTYGSVFSDAGFEVASAKDGQEAWDKLKDGLRPDAVFTGIIMPRMGGFELIERLRADAEFSRIPIAISSHRGLPEDEVRAKTLGVGDFIVQGFTTPREVVRRIRALLGEKKKYTIVFLADRLGGAEIVKLLNAKQGTYCVPGLNKEMALEMEESQEPKKFVVTLIC